MTTRTTLSYDIPQVWGPVATLLWGVLIAFVFVVTQLSVMGIYIGIVYGDIGADGVEQLLYEVQNNGVVISLATISTLIICGLMTAGIAALKKGSRPGQYLGLRQVDGKTVGNWSAMLIALVLLSDVLTTLLGKPVVPVFVTHLYHTTKPVWLLWIAFIISAPLFEELFFRGFLFAGFSGSLLGPAGAIVVTSALWSMIHLQYDLYGILTVFVLGLFLGYARHSSGSTLLTMGLHSFANFIATLEAAYISG